MFEHLARYQRILVSGPQRSGTTIATEMIAADTGYRVVREEAFDVYDVVKLQTILHAKNIVAQCPTMVAFLPELADENTLVVWMRRPVAEIIASQKRIKWRYESVERERLGLFESNTPIAVAKYEWWAANKHRMAHTFEVDYSSLKQHRLWVAPEQRIAFHARQTESCGFVQ